ncbi:MAG: HDOD domain-containing protein [Planctomycetota bacterium]|nr:MAG: HDOD domain-containing protein [Planctomycetota bacterium]
MGSLVQWLIGLVRRPKAAPAAAVSVRPAPAATQAQPQTAAQAQAQVAPPPPPLKPLRPTHIANFDCDPLAVTLVDWEDNLLLQIEQRVTQARYSLPELHANHLLLMSMVNNPSVDMRDLAETITHDPMLSGELLKIANSALYATTFPAETLQEAILRIGLRGMRSVIFAASMRSVLFKSKDLQEFADGVWRQSYSMGCIAREIGPLCGIDAERAFVIGLLHDVGKVPLLALLRECIPHGKRANLALVGRVFGRWHEVAGARLAKEWKLTPDLESVIRCHHDFKHNESEPRLAAFASLVHKLDLQLSLSSEREYRALAHGLEMDVLGVQEEQRLLAIRRAREAFEDANHEHLDGPSAALPASGGAASAAERSVA